MFNPMSELSTTLWPKGVPEDSDCEVYSFISDSMDAKLESGFFRFRRYLGQFFSTHDKHRSEEHTSELQSHSDLVCRLLLEKKKDVEPARAQPELYIQLPT